MGNTSGKIEITGPARVMLEKHGESALEGLKYWCKLGFPEMGSFSLKRLQELERRLLESEMKKKSSKLCWCAFYLWEREGQDRKKNQPGECSTIIPEGDGHTDQAGTRRQPLEESGNGVLPNSSTWGRDGWTIPHDRSTEPPGWQTSIRFSCMETQ